MVVLEAIRERERDGAREEEKRVLVEEAGRKGGREGREKILSCSGPLLSLSSPPKVGFF